jgi:hypothetical protein
MTRGARFVWVGVVVLAACGVAPGADGPRTLRGAYLWSDGGSKGDLEAVFTPSGEGRWEVEFRFRYGGEPHVYSGTAEGSLSEGELMGAVKTENNGRTFTFRGTFREGAFTGTHAEVGDDGEHPTGTLTLRG